MTKNSSPNSLAVNMVTQQFDRVRAILFFVSGNIQVTFLVVGAKHLNWILFRQTIDDAYHYLKYRFFDAGKELVYKQSVTSFSFISTNSSKKK